MTNEFIFKTDVLPQDIPILFRNRNLYHYSSAELDNLLKNNNIFKKITIPFTFTTLKPSGSNRNIDLLHPLAQLQIALFLRKYSNQIISFCDRSNYSLRKPIQINSTTINLSKRDQMRLQNKIKSFSIDTDKYISKDDVLEFYLNFFSLGPYKKITDALNSPQLTKDSVNYKYMAKLDINNFFPSIYTHSLAWAIFGNKHLAKKERRDGSFANRIDKLMTNINYGETNGITVGNEFSRTVAEVLMTELDRKLEIELFETIPDEDFKIYRYIDDYFIFFQEENIFEIIKRSLIIILGSFKLKINDNKTKLYKNPIFLTDFSITKLQDVVSLFEIKNKLSSSGYSRKHLVKNLFDQVAILCSEYESSQSKIVKYFLKTMLNKVDFEFVLPQYQELYFLEGLVKIYYVHPSNENLILLIASMSKFSKYAKEIQKIIDGKLEQENSNIEIITDEIEYKSFKNKNSVKKYSYIKNYNKYHVTIDHIFTLCHLILNNKNISFKHKYEIVCYLRAFDREISASYFIKILNDPDIDYFSLTAIAYYILDNDNTNIKKGYVTVLKKIQSAINMKIGVLEQYIDCNLLDVSEYFYIVNDFSKYPGFTNDTKAELKSELNQKITKKTTNDKGKVDFCMKSIYNQLTSKSYFKWEISEHDYMERLVKKVVIDDSLANSQYQ